MKILLLSDLHLSVQPLDAPQTDADVVVLAGDLGRPKAAMQWATQFTRPTLFVAGNHEYYGSDLTSTIELLRAGALGTSVNILECDQWIYQGVRFLGCTLWSDHRLYQNEQERERGIAMAVSLLYDFTRIRLTPDDDQKLSPQTAQQQCDKSIAWLDSMFREPYAGPTVVITHFAPARGSIHPSFADSPINACFVSDLSVQIARWQPQLWLHGHTHNSFDYRIGHTRVVCNPRGYAPGGAIENSQFNPGLVLEI